LGQRAEFQARKEPETDRTGQKRKGTGRFFPGVWARSVRKKKRKSKPGRKVKRENSGLGKRRTFGYGVSWEDVLGVDLDPLHAWKDAEKLVQKQE